MMITIRYDSVGIQWREGENGQSRASPMQGNIYAGLSPYLAKFHSLPNGKEYGMGWALVQFS